MKTKCSYCNYEWNTKSKLDYVTCPSCQKKVEKDKLSDKEFIKKMYDGKIPSSKRFLKTGICSQCGRNKKVHLEICEDCQFKNYEVYLKFREGVVNNGINK